MTRNDVRNIVTAAIFGLIMAAVVAIVSIVIAAPRVWPGTVLAFLMNGLTVWLYLDRTKRRSR